MKKIEIVNNSAPTEGGVKRCDPQINPAVNGMFLEWTEVSQQSGGKKGDPYANMSSAYGGTRKSKVYGLRDAAKCMDEFIAIAKEDGMEMDEEKETSMPPDEKKKVKTPNQDKPDMVKDSSEEKDKEEEVSPEDEGEGIDE